MAVVLAAVAVAGVSGGGCSDTSPSGHGHAKGQKGRPSARPTVRRPGPAIWDVAVAGPRLVFAAGTIGLERSADGGRSWTASAAAPGPYFQLNVVSERVVFAAGRGTVLRTVDGGQSWHALPRTPASAGGSVVINFWSASSGVAAIPTRPGGNPYLVTRDGGQRWRPLRIADWSLGQGGLPTQSGGQAGGSVCFVPGGIGWAVASQAGHSSILESPDQGRHWEVALPWRVLPQRGRPGVAVAGCTGDAAWVLVGQSDRYGEPAAVDLLHSTDLGRSWLDVLRWGYRGFPGPAVPSPPGGPRALPSALAPYIDWLAAPEPDAAWIALTGDKEGQTGFGSTGDGGLTWHFRSFPGNPNSRQQVPPAVTLPPLILETLTAADARRAWMMLARGWRSGASTLYSTDDGGATWSKIARFRTGLPPPRD
jgi:hypothetical protein